MRDNILIPISEGLDEIATFNPATISNTNNLAVEYIGEEGKWIPFYDYYPDGKIEQKNMTDYQIGTNGVVYGPQYALRASASHLNQYAMMFANKGKTKQGRVVLQPSSVA